MTVIIEEARAGEADALTRLALAAKALWGYDEAFMERCRAELTVHERDLKANQVFVARDLDRALGFYQLLMLDESLSDLDMLFVDPGSIGTGVGGALMRHARTLARANGAATMRITADPHAVAFYEHCGAVLVGSSISSSTGRSLPVYEIAL